ncbi:MAG: hypothetical protein H6867_02805 [Rhodospirillales bacterium]|nr:hypothetical protein [Rhodospirillales bacterium]MCB9997119.1 hypothetical protein [Rhodospirillales bacterium]
MNRLTHIFNYASVPLYLLGEGLQRLSAGVKGCTDFNGAAQQACHKVFEVTGPDGIDIYSRMPIGGQEMRYYFSGFFGAAALNFLSGRYFPALNRLLPDIMRPALFDKAEKANLELSAAFSMAALTHWELTHQNFGIFDWKDMGVYVAAVGLSYALNKHAQLNQKRPDIPAAAAPSDRKSSL